MAQIDFEGLMNYAKAVSGLTPERIALLAEFAPLIAPRAGEVTDKFYGTLQTIDKAKPFLEGRIELLKQTHRAWLVAIFKGPHDRAYTEMLYNVGDRHVKVKLPVEFMAGGTTLIQNELISLAAELCGNDMQRYKNLMGAINAVLGFSLMVMQESYQSSSLSAELHKFLSITGMSETLFHNLAKAYKG